MKYLRRIRGRGEPCLITYARRNMKSETIRMIPGERGMVMNCRGPESAQVPPCPCPASPSASPYPAHVPGPPSAHPGPSVPAPAVLEACRSPALSLQIPTCSLGCQADLGLESLFHLLCPRNLIPRALAPCGAAEQALCWLFPDKTQGNSVKGHHERVRSQPYGWGTGTQAKGRSVKGERKQASEKEIHFHLYFHSFYCTVADTGSRLNGFRGISSTMTCLWFLIALHRGDSNQITVLQAENTP